MPIVYIEITPYFVSYLLIQILSHLEIEQFNQSLPVPITSNEELELFLRFQHETANIIYVR